MSLTVLDAQEVIRRHQRTVPVQVVPIAEDLGLKVYRQKNWPDNLSGMICRDADKGGSSGYAIFVNANHAETRRRFTIAHEIAHFALHRHLIGDGIKDDALYRSGLSGAIEAQANAMAADILMPWHLVNAEIASGHDTVPLLASVFKVSRSSMSIRMGVPYETKEAPVVI
jgi:Zn-dependent peptidase ImmA (M78 family)